MSKGKKECNFGEQISSHLKPRQIGHRVADGPHDEADVLAQVHLGRGKLLHEPGRSLKRALVYSQVALLFVCLFVLDRVEWGNEMKRERDERVKDQDNKTKVHKMQFRLYVSQNEKKNVETFLRF